MGTTAQEMADLLVLLDPRNEKARLNALSHSELAKNKVLQCVFGEHASDNVHHLLKEPLEELATNRFEKLEALRSKNSLLEDALTGKPSFTRYVADHFVTPLSSMGFMYFQSIVDLHAYRQSILDNYTQFLNQINQVGAVFNNAPLQGPIGIPSKNGSTWIEKSIGATYIGFSTGLILTCLPVLGSVSGAIGIAMGTTFFSTGVWSIGNSESNRNRGYINFFNEVKEDTSHLENQIAATYRIMQQKTENNELNTTPLI